MFANRFTVLVDACSLVPALNRNLLLSLAEAEFFRVRWSAAILNEAERAIARVIAAKGVADAADRAKRARAAMEAAFEDALVTGHEGLIAGLEGLPDPEDAHVTAAAVSTRASIIVTENLKHFPKQLLGPLDLDAKKADDFITDTIDLDKGQGGGRCQAHARAVSQTRETSREPAARHEGCRPHANGRCPARASSFIVGWAPALPRTPDQLEIADAHESRRAAPDTRSNDSLRLGMRGSARHLTPARRRG